MIWVGTWASAMCHGDESGDIGLNSAFRVSQDLSGSTLRQIIRTTMGGARLRFAFSNEYGETSMVLRTVRVARAIATGFPDIDATTSTPVTFDDGSQSIIIPPGERVLSDDIRFKAYALERIAVSICFGDAPRLVACHVGARANSFIARGNMVSDETFKGGAINTHWFALTNADVWARVALHQPGTQQPEAHRAGGGGKTPRPCSIVVLGDSITDGYGLEEEDYTRWTDVLADRLQGDSNTRHLSVINMGIGSNRLLNQKNPPTAQHRFERDVLNQPGVGYFVFLIGLNDLLEDTSLPAEKITTAYNNMTCVAKEKGLKTYGCTLTPYSRRDPRRLQINEWLRQRCESGHLDGLLDFDELLRDGQNPEYILPEYDNDGVHPNVEAYKAMGELAYLTFAKPR